MVKMMQELEATLIHHDTITGTSPQRIIKSSIDKMESLEIRNSITMVELVGRKVEERTGLRIEGLN